MWHFFDLPLPRMSRSIWMAFKSKNHIFYLYLHYFQMFPTLKSKFIHIVCIFCHYNFTSKAFLLLKSWVAIKRPYFIGCLFPPPSPVPIHEWKKAFLYFWPFFLRSTIRQRLSARPKSVWWNSLGESYWGKVREMPWDNFLSPLRSFRPTSSS